MTERELNQKLQTALTHAAPDRVEDVLSRCSERKGNGYAMNEKKEFRAAPWLAAACLALVLAGGSALYYFSSAAVAAVVSLDVNPSIELRVNRWERVISAEALNADAEVILEGMDLRDADLSVAVNAVVGSLLQHGYLEKISSAILISVEDGNADRASRLEQALTAEVDASLKNYAANASVLSQTIRQEPALEQQARENNISVGKAHLVREIMERGGYLEVDSDAALTQLSGLDVGELKQMLESGNVAVPIGREKAGEQAKRYAGLADEAAVIAEVEPELDERAPHYEVELKTLFGEFEYTVDAYTGEVLSGRRDVRAEWGSTQSGQPAGSASTGQVTADGAKNAALAHAGVKESEAAGLRAEKDWDDGRLTFEVEFRVGAVEYDYEVDAATGVILSHSAEGGGQSSADPVADTRISRDEARDAALAHAGLALGNIRELEVEAELDEAVPHYEVSFDSGRWEYDYTIDAVTGAVLAWEKDD